MVLNVRALAQRVLACALVLQVSWGLAQSNIPPATEEPYPGTLVLDVNLTDLDRKIMDVHETIAVKPGALTLLYPQWLPGRHSPVGSVSKLAGLHIRGNGKLLAWQRDPVDVYAFHVEVPVGVSTLQLDFQYLSPLSEATGRVVMTPEIVGLQWDTVLLYPAGAASSKIQVQANAQLPNQWNAATALNIEQRHGDRIAFKPVTLERLVDSPLWAGKYTRRIELDAGSKAPVYLNLFADSPDNLEATSEHIALQKQLVHQADALFASRHFTRYEFLLALSDTFSAIGLEHSESTEIAQKPAFFTEWKKSSASRVVLAHEYAHSWNGKFRRPADLTTPNFNVPMQDSLLWVYEGQTQYWGQVLAARSGLVSTQDSLDLLAATVADLAGRSGRQWRDLQDTTLEPIINRRAPMDWSDWQRSEEYYTEGQMIWLGVDAKLRELTTGAKSLDDFARVFFGTENGRIQTLSYTFNDVVQVLHQLASWDWASYLRERLDAHDNRYILEGLHSSGWDLVFSDKQSDVAKAEETNRRRSDFRHSLGFVLDRDGKLINVKWGGPAFRAGLANQTVVVAVNGIAYKVEILREAVTRAKDGSGVELLVKTGNRYRNVKLDYRDGLRYPKLERIANQKDWLSEILAPRK